MKLNQITLLIALLFLKGAMPNILTAATYCDPLAKTPYHKNVRVKMEKVG